MNKKVWLALVLTFALVISACAAPGAPASDSGSGEAAMADGPTQFRGIWPYTVPPAGHFNTYVSNSVGLGIYQHLQEPPLFFYMWADDDWMPVAGESWEWADDLTVRVTLPSGAVWSDGSAYSSKDVVDTFYVRRLQGLTVWKFLEDVVAVDDTTVDFKLLAPSNTVLRQIFREQNSAGTERVSSRDSCLAWTLYARRF